MSLTVSKKKKKCWRLCKDSPHLLKKEKSNLSFTPTAVLVHSRRTLLFPFRIILAANQTENFKHNPRSKWQWPQQYIPSTDYRSKSVLFIQNCSMATFLGKYSKYKCTISEICNADSSFNFGGNMDIIITISNSSCKNSIS